MFHRHEHTQAPADRAARAIALTTMLFLGAGASRVGAQQRLEANGSLLAAQGVAWVAHGDLDGDGDEDLVTTNQGTGLLTVTMNEGLRRFGPRTVYPAGATNPLGIAIADLDGDGDKDVAVATPLSNAISVFMNTGNGTLVAGSSIPAVPDPHYLEAADLDGDGDVDLVVDNWSSGTVSVMTNAGNGTFAGPLSYPAGPADAGAFALADVDGDGDIDLGVVNQFTQSFSVLFNAGDATFGTLVTHPTRAYLQSLAFADLDGDGDADLALSGASSVLVLKNPGDGTFAQHAVIPANWSGSAILVADVDGSGGPDLVLARNSDSKISVLRNLGNASFAPAETWTLNAGPTSITSADLDGDGRVDIVAAVQFHESLELLYNGGNGTFAQALTGTYVSAGTYQFDSGDLDADGDVDLVVGGANTYLAVLLNDGRGEFGAPVPYPIAVNIVTISLHDLDGDGDLDIVALDNYDAVLRVLWNQGNGTFTAPTTLGAGLDTGSLIGGDFDGDGDVDLLTSSTTQGGFWMLSNQGGGSFLTSLDTTIVGGVTAAIDVDGDLDLDLVSARLGDLAIQLNNGSATFAAPIHHPCMTNPGSFAAGDADGDGLPEIAVGAFGGTVAADGVWTYGNTGNGTFAAPVVLPVQTWTYSMAWADLDGDGRNDLVVAGYNTAHVSVFTNDGNGGLQPPQAFAAFGFLGRIEAADFEGDGDIDLEVFDAGRYALLRNAHAAGSVFCAGDGVGTACPCGNTSPVGAGAGCASSLGFGGTLRGAGVATIGGDHLVLEAAQIPNAAVLFFQGTSALNGGAGFTFGDGLRCAGGAVRRLGTHIAAGGSTAHPSPGGLRVSVAGAVTTPGVRHYQAWYRNAAGFCTPSTFNYTNGITVSWRP